MSLSPLGSKQQKFTSVIVWYLAVVFANLQICEFTNLRLPETNPPESPFRQGGRALMEQIYKFTNSQIHILLFFPSFICGKKQQSAISNISTFS
jgi:hypothetical protein